MEEVEGEEGMWSRRQSWNKRDMQRSLLLSCFMGIVIYHTVTNFLPYVMTIVTRMKIRSEALYDVQAKQAAAEGETASSLEEEAKRLREEAAKRRKHMSDSEAAQQTLVIPPEGRYKIKLDVSEGENDSKSMGKKKVKKSENGFIQPNSKKKSTQASESKHRHLDAKQESLDAHNVSSGRGYLTAEGNRRAELFQQDIAFEEAMRLDRTRQLLSEERLAEFQRMVSCYTASSIEPNRDDDGTITVVFKISDDVYVKSGVAPKNLKKKHGKISRRFLLSSDVRQIFSFILCHVYKFGGCEDNYLGGEIPALFTVYGFNESNHDSTNIVFLPFDLICSYPRLVLNSSVVFSQSSEWDDSSTLTIEEVGLKNNTLLTLRPADSSELSR